jgi:hypothetical protein
MLSVMLSVMPATSRILDHRRTSPLQYLLYNTRLYIRLTWIHMLSGADCSD